MKIYSTMLTSDYVPDWDLCDGIREIIVNGLDSPAPFEYDIGLDYIKVSSKGITLDISCFLLGKSGNRSNTDAVGRHGEGMLVSLVPILREGGKITIQNGSVEWIPSLEMDYNFNQEVLVIREDAANHPNDYTVLIENISQDDIDTIVERCLYFQKEEDLGNILTSPCGSRVFTDIEGKLFVGGYWVCDTSMQYSYDLHPSKLHLNRDRKQPSHYDLKAVTAKLLQDVATPRFVAEAAMNKVEDVSAFEYSWQASVSKSTAHAAYEVFKDNYKTDAIAVNRFSDYQELEAKGVKNVVLINSESFYEMLERNPEYADYKQEILDSLEDQEDSVEDDCPIRMLEDWWVHQDSVGFNELLTMFKQRGLKFEREASAHIASIQNELLPF